MIKRFLRAGTLVFLKGWERGSIDLSNIVKTFFNAKLIDSRDIYFNEVLLSDKLTQMSKFVKSVQKSEWVDAPILIPYSEHGKEHPSVLVYKEGSVLLLSQPNVVIDSVTFDITISSTEPFDTRVVIH